MKIRSITCFCNPGWPLAESKIRQTGHFLATAKAAYQDAGYEVQTLRLATTPFASILNAATIHATPLLARELSALLPETGIDYVSLGPALPTLPPSYAIIPQAIVASENVFFSAVIADRERGVYPSAIQATAEIVRQCATLSADGFANLRFSALANVPAGVPFFPAAYHRGGQASFALACEAADLAVSAFQQARSVPEGQQILIRELEAHAEKLQAIARTLVRQEKGRFGGIDFSLAPFPEESRSLGAAFERLGVPRVGQHGSLAAAAILTDSLERARFPRAGFSSLMMPVLEDSILAKRAAEGVLTVKDLLLYSAVCGTGLDTVPLPGDVSADQLSALLFDVAALALRLDKPLTARLMPLPGKQAGDPVAFDFAYFAPSRVLRLDAAGLQPPLYHPDPFVIQPRRWA